MKKSLIYTAYACLAALFLTACVSVPTESKTSNENVETKESDTSSIVGNEEETTEEQIHSDEDVITIVEDEEESENDIFIASLDNVNLTFKDAPKIVTVRNKFVKPFTILVTDNDEKPLSNFNITVKYPSEKIDGEVTFKTEDLVTDANGVLAYTALPPQFACLSEFTVYPTPINSDEEVVKACENMAISTPWKVKSDIVSKQQLLFVWNYRVSGNPDRESTDLLNALKAEGISVGNAPFSGNTDYFSGSIKTVWEDHYDLIDDKNSYGYIIYGTIKYVKGPTATENGNYECELIADIQTIRMKDGSVPFHKTFKQKATGENWNYCDRNAKEAICQQIVDALLYEL